MVLARPPGDDGKDTLADPVVMVLPKLSCSVTIAANPEPAATEVAGCVVIASFGAAPLIP